MRRKKDELSEWLSVLTRPELNNLRDNLAMSEMQDTVFELKYLKKYETVSRICGEANIAEHLYFKEHKLLLKMIKRYYDNALKESKLI